VTTVRFPISANDPSGGGWAADPISGLTLWQAVKDANVDPNSLENSSHRALASDTTKPLEILFDTSGIAVNPLTQVKVHVWANYSTNVTVQCYLGGAWQTATISGTSSTWDSVTFSGSWTQTDLNNLKVRLSQSIGDTLEIHAVNVELTFTVGSAAATGYSLTGPATGTISSSSTFTTKLTPFTYQTPTHAGLTVVPAVSGGSGSFLPASVVLDTANATRTFTFTPTTRGSFYITATDNGGFTDPDPLNFVVTGSAQSTEVTNDYAYSGPRVFQPKVNVRVTSIPAYSGPRAFIRDANRFASPSVAYSGPWLFQQSDNVKGHVHFNISATGVINVGLLESDGQGVHGNFIMIGTEMPRKIWPSNRGIQITGFRSMVLLGPTPIPESPGATTFDLDWAQDAMPFCMATLSAPPLMTLDWARRAMPFASNFNTLETVNGKCHMSILATSTIGVDGNVAGKCHMFVIAELTLGEDGALGEVHFEIDAIAALDITTVPDGQSHMSILGDASIVTSGTVRMPGAVHFTIHADSFGINGGDKRTVKPCEIPGAILHLTSNIPAATWQNNYNARFNWEEIWTCDRTPTGHRVVDGYFYKLSRDPDEHAAWDWDSTRVPIVNVDLRDTGTGDLWFHVAAYNEVGIGPTALYNVRYNNRPTVPFPFFMRIDGVDSFSKQVFVAYDPVVDHEFTWSDFLDVDGDSLIYLLEISLSADFTVDPISGVGIALEAESIPASSYFLTQRLAPGSYYWRVRAFDGSEYSDWSPTGKFRVNYPPEQPTELAVSQIT
jgi:hypothetical protein